MVQYTIPYFGTHNYNFHLDVCEVSTPYGKQVKKGMMAQTGLGW